MPDLAITPFVIGWFMQDPVNAIGVMAWGCFGVWALFYLDCSGDAGLSFDADGGD